MPERPICSMSIEISYGDEGQHPRHERLEWTTEVHPVTVQIEKRPGFPKTQMGEVVLTASRHPASGYAGPSAPLPRLGLATTEQMLKELEARLDADHQLDARRAVRRVYGRLSPEDLAYRTVDDADDRVQMVQPHVPEYWYVVVHSIHQFKAWRDRPENAHLSMSQMIALPTSQPNSADKIRGREIRSGDKLVRLGDYDQGAYWHDIEDALKFADRNGVWS